LQKKFWSIIIKEKRNRKSVEESLMKITKDTIIGDIIDIDPSTTPYFLEMGMHCLGCPASRGETLEDACMVHGINPDELIEKLNQHLSK
jgi:hybrid cluster-associated redox disulfide protein